MLFPLSRTEHNDHDDHDDRNERFTKACAIDSSKNR